ncbi:MerR family transcriptional regulator [Paenibacillus sp. FSL A5-0031]|uniref:MerR family transcriptional regulator n=1 Tax=Paenibacillus sp. FSL A5-0031 TaxID=1920420 RepID=UPI00096BDCA2|nr:MerR family transcriptional regulator [Paenibacillus sp. FSL A5-0031]OME82246.1 MerR family transcriptional regulator [Paenibacillus sp. FSL A5-0031]
MDLLKIEEVAKRTGLTKRAIRYYEDFGLISAPERTQGGIRLYSEENIEKINKILLVKEVLGFSLAELQQYMEFQSLIEQQKSEYRTSEDREARKLKLFEISQVLHKEKMMIDMKIKRMEQFKEELTETEKRVQKALDQLQE